MSVRGGRWRLWFSLRAAAAGHPPVPVLGGRRYLVFLSKSTVYSGHTSPVTALSRIGLAVDDDDDDDCVMHYTVYYYQRLSKQTHAVGGLTPATVA